MCSIIKNDDDDDIIKNDYDVDVIKMMMTMI